MYVPVAVRQVASAADFETFLYFPWTLFQDDPHWVPPLVSIQRHKLDQANNPTWKYMEGDYFVAWRGSQPVGTIAAFINHRHNAYHNERIGFFGMFYVQDDQEAANALLTIAADYVRVRGYDAIRGPVSFSTNDECGILIKGFEHQPAILTPYNPPYFQALLENAPGFAKVMNLNSYHFTLGDFHESKSLEQSLRVTRRNNKRRQISVRALDGKHVHRELQLLKSIYNEAWEENWGFVPLTDEELDELVHDLGQFLEPRLTLFAFVEGNPAAFLLAIPDMNEVLRHAQPRPDVPEPLTLLRALWHWKIRSKITRIRIALLGVNARYRGIGVEAALFAQLAEQFQLLIDSTPWRTADAGWVLETNEAMHRLVLALGGEPYKQYRLYEQDLTSED